MGLWLEGQAVDPVTTAAKTQVWQAYTVAVHDGQLTLDLRDLGGKNKTVAIAGLRVTAVADDTERPTVDIQAPPTAAGGVLADTPLVFHVTFSEPVTGFTADDVQVQWTGPGVLTKTLRGVGSSYEVTLSGMAGNGQLGVSVDEAAAVDLSGNTSVGRSDPGAGHSATSGGSTSGRRSRRSSPATRR